MFHVYSKTCNSNRRFGGVEVSCDEDDVMIFCNLSPRLVQTSAF